MLDQYKMKGPITKIEVEIEQEVAEKLSRMAAHTSFTQSELANTAFKRFISAHKDFFPSANLASVEK